MTNTHPAIFFVVEGRLKSVKAPIELHLPEKSIKLDLHQFPQSNNKTSSLHLSMRASIRASLPQLPRSHLLPAGRLQYDVWDSCIRTTGEKLAELIRVIQR